MSTVVLKNVGEAAAVVKDKWLYPGESREVTARQATAVIGMYGEGVLEVASGRLQEVDATEAAVRLAEEMGIDLAGVEGSGSGGRITKADVEAAVE